MRRSTRPSSKASSALRRARPGTHGRPRSARRAPSRPLLTPRQLNEGLGVLLAAFGLLVLVAMVLPHGSMLAGLHGGVAGAFDAGWPLIVLSLVAAGVYLIWPSPPPLRPLDVAAGVVAVLAALGLLGLALGAGGGTRGQAGRDCHGRGGAALARRAGAGRRGHGR